MRTSVKRKRIVSACLAAVFALSLTACGKKTVKEEVPELVETTVTNESYRPVVRGNVGDVTIIPARAVPRSYGQYFEKAQSVSEIYVNLGDYVEEGDKIASADTTELDEKLKALRKSKTGLEEEIEQVKEKYELDRKHLEYEKKACEEMNDTEGAAEKQKEINLLDENTDYHVDQLENQITSVSSDIQTANSDRDKLILYATHSGYVTYKFNMVESNAIAAYQNVAMISDYDDVYIEAETVSLQKFGKYRTADRMVALYNGKKYEASEDVYSSVANSYATSTGKYPRVRFSVSEADIKLGDVVPILIYPFYHENVLIVGNDSIRNDGDNKYVFVEGENGSMEKRLVEVGYSDSINTEIISGLEEGEKVYYLSDSLKPLKYEEVNVAREDYVQYSTSNTSALISTNVDVYSAPNSGTFKDYDVPGNKYVEEGVTLFTLEVKYSDAERLEEQQIIDQTRKQHDQTVKANEARLEELDKAIIEADKAEAPVATDTDAVRDSLYKKEKLEIEKKLLMLEIQNEQASYEATIDELTEQYNKEQRIIDNGGIVAVYSKRAGNVVMPNYEQSWEVGIMEGVSLLAIEYGEADKLIVKTDRNASASNDDNFTKKKGLPRPGTPLIFSDGSNEYTGTCIANIGDDPSDNIYYLEERDGHATITTCLGNIYHNIGTGYFAKADDEKVQADSSKYSISYEVISVKDAIVIPKDCIYSEKKTSGSGSNYFVWVKDGDELIKHYIEYEPEYSDRDKALILSGLEEGDIIVLEEKEVEK